jgi:hypothetical protein
VAILEAVNSKIVEIYCGFRQTINAKNIVMWPLDLSSSPWPPSSVYRVEAKLTGIKLHAKTPLVYTSEVCIMGKNVPKALPAVEARGYNQHSAFHSLVIGLMPSPTMCGYRYIMLFTDDYSRYTKVYNMKFMLQAPERLKSMSLLRSIEYE